MENKKDKPVKGIKISSLNVFMLILSVVICILLFLSSKGIKSKYNDSFASMKDYYECAKAINNFRDSSEFLTDQVRLFSENYDMAFIDNYFNEKNKLKTAQKAFDFISEKGRNDDVIVTLQMAMTENSLLEKSELYSIKLIVDALEITQNVPSKVSAVELKPEDKNLPKKEKLEKAKSVLFDYQYLSSKEKVTNFSEKALNELVNSYMNRHNADDKLIFRNYTGQIIHLVIFLVLSVVFFILMLIFVILPLDKHIESILKCKRMVEAGSFETRYIAKSYNALCDKNEVKASILKHKAEHDPLTGLINREAFDQIKEAYTTSEESIAYLLIDIDFFKKINDQYGHQTGDEVLKKISNLLMEQFRATDYVARVGGDEFAVIMTKIGPCPTETIQRKIDGVNMTLQSVEDGLPSVSLSVGVSFSDGGFKSDLVDQADVALYRVKKGGRCNCSFFLSEE